MPVIELQTVFGHDRCASVLNTLSDALYDGRVDPCVLNTVTVKCTDTQFETLIVVQLLFLWLCALVFSAHRHMCALSTGSSSCAQAGSREEGEGEGSAGPCWVRAAVHWFSHIYHRDQDHHKGSTGASSKTTEP